MIDCFAKELIGKLIHAAHWFFASEIKNYERPIFCRFFTNPVKNFDRFQL